jgi:hypothetical protein
MAPVGMPLDLHCSDAVRAYLEMLFQNLAHLFTPGGLLLG